jgi:hypothetical protein
MDGGTSVKEILRSNDVVFLSWADAMLRAEGIDAVVFDTHAAVLDGSISAVQRRLMVSDQDHARARQLLTEAGAGDRLAR